jgi:DNA replication protein DnaC
METKTSALKESASQLKLAGLNENFDHLLLKAQQEQVSYLDFAFDLLKTEIEYRNNKNLAQRLNMAKMPDNHDLNGWKEIPLNGLSRQQLAQLRECFWMEQNYNIVLMGPSGTGKTFIASGLCFDAIKKGYKACFRTMEQINTLLKMKDITKSAAREYAAVLKTNILVMDDIMMFPMERKQAVALFNLIDYLHLRASIIITTNKSPDEWVKILDDEVLATAILDRILFKCEIIKLAGKSYRLENRKTIFS